MLRIILIFLLFVSCNNDSKTSAPAPTNDIYNPNTTTQINQINEQLKIHQDLLNLQANWNETTDKRLSNLEIHMVDITDQLTNLNKIIQELQDSTETTNTNLQLLTTEYNTLTSEMQNLQIQQSQMESLYDNVNELIQNMTSNIATLQQTFKDPSSIITIVNQNISQITDIQTIKSNIATLNSLVELNDVFIEIPNCGHGYVAIYDSSANINHLLVTEIKGQIGNVQGIWELFPNQTVNLLINNKVTCSNVVWTGKVLHYQFNNKNYTVSLNY